MEPTILTHYKILGELGRGGMGVVYKAFDTRLNRPVAIKLLRQEVVGDPARRQRFFQEARAASALNHPNIITIHEIDHADELDFLVFEFIDGRPLGDRIPAGGLEWREALRYATQMADALAAAHGARIVHRDLKPGNVMVTASGVVKVLDFGLAKQALDSPASEEEATRSAMPETAKGTILGTAPYMSPEQAQGKPVDARSDVFSFGCVLYEMLTGKRCFQRDNPLATLSAILYETPELPAQVPAELRRMVGRCLEKEPGRRYESGIPLAADLRKLAAPATGSPVGRWAVGAMLAALLAGGGFFWYQRWEETRVDEEIRRLLKELKLFDAYFLMRDHPNWIPRDSDSMMWKARIADGVVTYRSNPPGAEVVVRDYSNPASAGVRLGVTPLEKVLGPIGLVRYTITKPGFDPVEGSAAFVTDGAVTRTLSPAGTSPKGMVHVSGGMYRAADGVVHQIGEYWLDRYEVTNRQYKEFVDAGGYEKQQFWKALDSFSTVQSFRDSTGRPGPAIWEFGSYPRGQGEYPVSGVSWYEASAYAEWAGKSLPTIYHWRHASGGYGYFGDIVRMSNFGTGPAPAGAHLGISPYGSFDMAGNVREWCFNSVGEKRYLLGGAWGEPSYNFNGEQAQPPASRRAVFGFRCVRYIKPPGDALLKPVERIYRDLSKEKPVSDREFALIKSLYTYSKAPLEERVEAVDDSFTEGSMETVSYLAAYNNERIIASLFLPKGGKPPYQAVIYVPGAGGLIHPTSMGEFAITAWAVRGGRALLIPALKGTFERRETGPNRSSQRERTIPWSKDLGRSIDYLATRSDIDSSKIAMHALSLGARVAPMLLAVDPRFRAAVFTVGGFAQIREPDEVEAVNFLPRVKTPVLMLNNREDFIFPLEQAQRPFFQVLGTPAADKKHLVFPGGHAESVSATEAAREALAWLDKYLGPVTPR